MGLILKVTKMLLRACMKLSAMCLSASPLIFFLRSAIHYVMILVVMAIKLKMSKINYSRACDVHL